MIYLWENQYLNSYMKPLTINYLNGLVLLAAGLYGYFSILPQSVTALIPAFAGIIFLILGLIWNKSSKIIAHIAVVLVLIMLAMCVWRFTKIDAWDAKKYIFSICIASNLLALIVFVKSFIDARRINK